jgi:hypothetical protein
MTGLRNEQVQEWLLQLRLQARAKTLGRLQLRKMKEIN